MAEQNIQGYLIKKIDYQVFDEIITFIGTDGNKYTCLSLGSKRITSKNARNLFLGNYCEFEVFLARHKDKISKLKKVHILKSND